ncbi:MAG: trigger factor [bacterium]|nr:trigger factor [bacterium]
MKVSVTEKSPIVREMEVVVDSERVENAYGKAFKEALKHLALPGFRRGKVPAYMGRKHITNGMLSRQVAEEIIPVACEEALEQENIRPVSRPNYSVKEIERGKDLVFTAEFEVVPSVEMKDYKGLDITQERYEVKEEDIDKSLERTREGRATLEVVEDRGLQENDIAFVTFSTTENGVEVPNGKGENFPMELTTNHLTPEFLENLYGMKKGEDREFDCDFPESYASDLAGKHLHFKFHLNEIKFRKMPELNDEFAKTVSEYKTLAELRAHIMEVMTNRIQAQAEQGVAEKIYMKIGDQVSNEMLPRGLVRYHARVFHNNVLRSLSMQNMTLADMLKAQGKNETDWNNHAVAMGVGEARLEIIVRAIAAQENITVTDEEVEEVIDNEAKAMGQSSSYVYKNMEKSGTLDILRYSILRDKVTSFLVKSANVTYVLPGAKDEAAAQAEAPAEEGSKAEENAPAAEAAAENTATENKD